MKFRTIFVHCRLIPWGKYDALALFPFLFYKGEYPNQILLNHERIHFEQQKELFILGFFILYLFYWLRYGYQENPFEREAIVNQKNAKYLDDRSSFSWVNYLKTV